MKHLEDEDLARMIEGKISKNERENFLKHLSQCETCLNIYSETLKFVEEDRKEKTLLRFPNLKELAPRFRQAITAALPARRLIPAAALLLILLVTVPFLLNQLSRGKIERAQIGYIKEMIEHNGVRSFSGSGNKIDAAVRAGIFVQDLAVVVNAGGEPELQTEITRLLSSQLKPFIADNSPLIPEPARLEKQDFETMDQRIRGLWERESLAELFDFGSFLEHAILSTFAGKQPQPADIERYRRILLNYQDQLAPGVFKELNKLKPTTPLEDIKRIFSAIAEIFLSLE